MKYAFILDHRQAFNVCSLCRVLEVSPGGGAWVGEVLRGVSDGKQTPTIRSLKPFTGAKVTRAPSLVLDLHDAGCRRVLTDDLAA